MHVKTRRTFLKSSIFTTTAFMMPYSELHASASMLDTLEVVQRDLYGDANDAPSFKEINSRAYISLILTHTRVTQDTKEFIKNGVLWLEEEALTLYKKTYIKLDKNERHKTLKSIAKNQWGENWINTMLGFIYEAVLGDPVYGINKNESGWKWLHHASGLPRPKKPLL